MSISKRYMSRRDFLRMSGLTALGVMAAACAAPQAAPAAPAAGEAKPKEKAPAEKAAAGPTEIVYLTWAGPEELKVMQTITKAFEEATPDVKVKIEVPPQNYWDKLQTMVAGGVAPDMFRMDYVYMAVWGSKGVPIPLDDYIQAEIDKSQFYERVFLGYQYQGKQLALPQDVNSQVLFYNKRLFDEAGVSYPDETWKWDPETGGDFLEAAKKLTKEKQWGYSQDWYWEPISPWIWENGGDWYNKDHTKSTMSDPKTKGGLQFLADLLLKYEVSPTPAQMSGRDAPTLFGTGNIAMYQSGRWMVPTFRAIEGLEWDVAVLPEGPAGRWTTQGGTGSCISNQSKHPDAAWKYAKWYVGEMAQKLIGKLAFSTPILKSVLSSEEFLKSVPPENNKVWGQTLEWLRPMPVTTHFDQVDNIRSTELTEVWTGRKSVDDACQAMDKQINDVLAS
ncbi:MAG: sugar ABC transporter substrate-binding protein [Anaerolineae bacterium]|nr:sugar ABC transporter substrate-binding protein [Anaerolineae bacterium]